MLIERLKIEYRVAVDLQPLPFRFARWVRCGEEGMEWMRSRRDFPLLEDRNGSPVLLTESMWPLQYAQEKIKDLELFEVEPL